jgi:hypothetical protein
MSNTTMQINPDYFKTLTMHRGIVSHCKNVFGLPHRKSKTQCWRVWVRIKTDEGWTLMGYIGNATDEKSLPAVKKGDRVELDPIILSDWKRVEGKDERPKDFARTLTGKIIRTPRVIVPSAAALGATPKNNYEDFDIPPVFALITADGETAHIFVPNPWHREEVLYRCMKRYDDGIWRFTHGNSLLRGVAVNTWNRLVGEDCTSRDIIENPLNGEFEPFNNADQFASNFSMKTTFFRDLVKIYGDYPRKQNA